MTPRVSVVVPTRDRRVALARALASIDAQSFRDFEVVVVDDGSADGTASWLRAEHPAVRLVELHPSCGAAAARNRGVERARGEIVAFLDDDDAWHPSYLETQVALFDAHPDAQLCSAGHVEIDGSGRLSRPDLRPLFDYADPLVHLLAECPLHTLSVVACRRTALARIGPFDEALTIVHDLDWYLRLVASGGRHEHNPALLVERSVPGGLVTRHQHWYAEERLVHRRLFARIPIGRRDQRRIRAARALLFARVGFAKGDLDFGLARLAEAGLASPLDSLRIAALRLRACWRRDATQLRGDPASPTAP
jgi:glycosyltransferase involved in cell wall biosynthesis